MALVTSPAPGTPAVLDATALAKRAYDEAVARSRQNITTTLRGYGYNADVNTDGQVSNLRVDAANPSGQYQQMLRSHAMNDMQLQDDAVGRGIHGGLAHQAESNARYGYAQDAATLGQGVTGAVSGYADSIQQAAYDRDQALWEAQRQAAQDAIANGDFNTPDYGPDPNYPYPDPGADTSGGDDGSSDGATDDGSGGGGIDNATRNKLIKQLYSRGVILSSWAKAHPAEAAALGVGSGYGSNNQLIRQVYGGTPPKPKPPAPKPAPRPAPRPAAPAPRPTAPTQRTAPKPAPKPAPRSTGTRSTKRS